MTPQEIEQRARDARILHGLAAQLEEMQQRHPEYITLQIIDTRSLETVARWLEDDVDQEQRKDERA